MLVSPASRRLATQTAVLLRQAKFYFENKLIQQFEHFSILNFSGFCPMSMNAIHYVGDNWSFPGIPWNVGA